MRELQGEDWDAVYQELVSQKGSILRRLHRIYVMRCLRKLNANLSLDDITLSVENLLDGWKESAEVFIFLLNWSENQISAQDEWTSTSLSLKLSAPWLHTDGILSIKDNNQERYYQWLRKAFQSWPVNFNIHGFTLDKAYFGSASHPKKVFLYRLFFHGLGYALGDDASLLLKGEYRAKLESELVGLVTREQGRIQLSPVLLCNVFEERDCINSIFSYHEPNFISYLWGADVFLQINSESRRRMVNEVLRQIANKPNDPNGWLHFSGFFLERMDPNDLVRITKATQGVDLENIFSAIDQQIGAQSLLFLLSDAASLSASDESRRIVETHLFKYSQSINSEESSAAHLLDIVARLSRSEQLQESLVKFTEIINAMIEVNPSIRPLCRLVIDNLMGNLPSNLRKILWQSYIRLRSED